MNADDARLTRLAAMTGELLAELDNLRPDDCARRLATYQRILTELGPLLPEAGRAELTRLRLPDAAEPLTPAELRIAHAQLLGWLVALHAEITSAARGVAAAGHPSPARAEDLRATQGGWDATGVPRGGPAALGVLARRRAARAPSRGVFLVTLPVQANRLRSSGQKSQIEQAPEW